MFGCPQRIGLENRFLWIVCGLNKIHLTLWNRSVPRYEFLITFSSRRKWLILQLGQIICKMNFNILCLKVRKWPNTHTHTHTHRVICIFTEWIWTRIACTETAFLQVNGLLFFFFFFTELLNTLINRKWPVKYMDTFRDLHKEYKVITTCFQSFD